MSESIVSLKISSVDKLTKYWIAEGERIATERIIKLLEEIVVNWRKNDLHNQADIFEYAIGLIKGEK